MNKYTKKIRHSLELIEGVLELVNKISNYKRREKFELC